jgi:hypothetical protein
VRRLGPSFVEGTPYFYIISERLSSFTTLGTLAPFTMGVQPLLLHVYAREKSLGGVEFWIFWIFNIQQLNLDWQNTTVEKAFFFFHIFIT